MKDKKPLDAGHRQVTIQTGREVTLRPLPWWAFDGLLGATWRASFEFAQEMAAAGMDGHTIAAFIFSFLGDRERWVVSSSSELVRWLVGPCIVGLTRDEKGAPCLDDYGMDEVLELLDTVVEMNDLARIGDRLKNSLLPAAKALTGPLAGGEEDEAATETSSKASAAG